jgi:hypothetical protein
MARGSSSKVSNCVSYFLLFFSHKVTPSTFSLQPTSDLENPFKSSMPTDHLPEHCDGTYITPDGRERTFYTLHLYLNDSVNANPASTTEKEAAPFPELLIKGGATTFHSNDMSRRLDVDPKAGRVLIFQHRGLLHSGDEVLEGVKYTMRSDLLFEFDEESGTLGGGKKH